MLTLYKASAGSGKTYTLAREYIKLLLGIKDKESGRYTLRKPGANAHRNILAITFTIAATNEMKRRIIDHLQLLGNHGDKSLGSPKSPYMGYLTEVYNASQQEVAAAARSALRELLMDFNQFNISTIDAFFQTVLRTFAREIDLPGNYDVELDEERVTGIGVGEMLSSLNFDNDGKTTRLTHWLEKFMQQSIDEGKGFNLFNRQSNLHGSLVKTMNKLLDENFKLHREEILGYLNDPANLEKFEEALSSEINRSKKRFTDAANEIFNAINSYGYAENKAIYHHLLNFIKKVVDGGWQEKISDTLAGAADPANVEKRFTAAFRKKSSPPEALDLTITDGCAAMCQSHRRANEFRLLRRNLYNFGLLGYLLECIKEYRLNNDIILLSDTNELLRRIICDDQTPFVYERLGYLLKHFLIDEFQDTSTLQWGNLKPLLLESLSTGNDNLIIGDEKQCIYRFRNSDPELLATKVKTSITANWPDSVTEQGNIPAENTNWRSSRDIVRFNNTIFANMARLAGVETTYSNITQQVAHKDAPGYVNLTTVDVPKDSDKTYEQLALERMATEIRRQIEAGYRPKDIAVIVRRRSEGEAVVNHLLELMENPDSRFPKMEITSSDSIELQSSPAIKLIISVLQIIDSPDASAGNRYKSARELAKLINRFEYFCNNRNLSASDALDKALTDGDDISSLATEAADMKCVNLPSLVERIIARYLSADEREASNIFLSAFQDQVIDYCSHGLSDIHSFLQWWQQSGCHKKLETPADMDALTIMTIHKVKGLQYPCVHIPFATWAMTEFSTAAKANYEWLKVPQLDGIDSSIIPPLMPVNTESALAQTCFEPSLKEIFTRQRIDNINLLYVAFTRAERELIITTKASDKSVAANELKSEPISLYIIESITANRLNDDDLTISLNDQSRWNGTALTIGSPTTPATTNDTPATCEAMPPYATDDSNEMWQLTRVDDLCERTKARERGIFLHDVLSSVRKSSDLKIAMRRRAYRIGLPANEESELLNTLSTAINAPEAARWFNNCARVVNERTIMLRDGRHYRPDRIVWTDDGTIEVIDYKFGEHHKKYADQVSRYVGFLKQMHPYATVRGYLWYPDCLNIIPV